MKVSNKIEVKVVKPAGVRILREIVREGHNPSYVRYTKVVEPAELSAPQEQSLDSNQAESQ